MASPNHTPISFNPADVDQRKRRLGIAIGVTASLAVAYLSIKTWSIVDQARAKRRGTSY
jgi:hypothetical protein